VYEQSIVMEIPHHTIPTSIFLLLETFPLLVPWLHQGRPVAAPGVRERCLGAAIECQTRLNGADTVRVC
jgi:hypothetical protein